MKESELMKYDWVMFDEEHCEPYEVSRKYLKVDKFNCGTIYGKDKYGFGTYICYCEEEGLYDSRKYGKAMPIPLTPEILKKNGFRESIEDGVYYFPEQYQEVNNRGFAVETNGDGEWYITDHQLIKFCHVHKFQHILRDCEMNDLADNFEVELT